MYIGYLTWLSERAESKLSSTLTTSGMRLLMAFGPYSFTSPSSSSYMLFAKSWKNTQTHTRWRQRTSVATIVIFYLTLLSEYTVHQWTIDHQYKAYIICRHIVAAWQHTSYPNFCTNTFWVQMHISLSNFVLPLVLKLCQSKASGLCIQEKNVSTGCNHKSFTYHPYKSFTEIYSEQHLWMCAVHKCNFPFLCAAGRTKCFLMKCEKAVKIGPVHKTQTCSACKIHTLNTSN